MKNALFVLTAFAAVLFSVACSEKGGEEEPIYSKGDFYITTHPEHSNAGMPTFVGFYMMLAFNEADMQRLANETHETYASFEMYSNDGQLQFVGEFADSEGRLRISDIFIYGNQYYDKFHYSYYQMLPTSASKDSEYEFAIKFYQPATDQYFMTPRYRLKIWAEGDRSKFQTTLIE